LDHAVRAEILNHPIEKLAADVLVHHFTATEPQGYLGLVTLGQEADEITHLDLVITLSRTGTKLHFLDLDLLLLALRRMGLLVGLEEELAVVHDAHDRRLRRRRDFDEIEPCGGRHLERVVPAHYAGLAPFGIDHSQLGCGDFLIALYALRRCTSDASILQTTASAATELGLETFSERVRRHRAQVLTAAGTHGKHIRRDFLIASDQ